MEKGKNLNIWLASQIRMDFIPIGKGTRMRAACLISFAVFVTLAGPVDYVCGYLSPSGVEIVPQNPTSCDIVDITLSGGWPDLCMPYDSTVSMVGNDIYIDVIWPDQSCPPMPTSWEWTESVGPLSVGTYTVYARLIGYPQTPEEYTQMTEFTVTDKQFVFNTESVTVPEGYTATFTVSLFGDPCEAVEVSVVKESGDDDIKVVSGGTLVFDSSNYSLPQTVTLTAAEDEDYINGTAIIRISAPGYITAEVSAGEWDDDTPRVVYVDRRAPGLCDGRGWMDAFTHLHDALSTASQAPEVEEICVAQGTYRPDQGITVEPGNREATFQLLDSLAIKGGYAGFGEPDPNARNIDLYRSILSGDLNGNDVAVADPCDLWHEPTRAENSYHVVIGSGTDATAILEGFTITGGNAGGSSYDSGGGMLNYLLGSPTLIACTFKENAAAYGGGMANYRSESAPTLVNCMFTRNWARVQGGGMTNTGNPTLINCTFTDNSSAYGGGIHCTSGGSLTLVDCTFAGNSVSWYGGGIQSWGASSLTLTNCIFNRNLSGEGGGIYSFNTNCTLTNCIFMRNSAIGGYRKQGWGGGMYWRDGTFGSYDGAITNCTFVHNSAMADGGGLCSHSFAKVTDCIFWGNSDSGGTDESAQIYDVGAEIDHCCIQGWTGNLGGMGNIGDEPLFVDSTGGNYHLSELSPCINAGDPNHLVDPNESDIDGQPRIIGGRVDMGADEFHCNNIAPIANAGEDQTVFGWIDGIAEVTLDGTGSYDDDGHPLTYLWSWTIDGETYTATGPSPIIELPVGEHIIELIVNDRVDDSEPDEVVVTVIEPVQSRLWLVPRVINRHSRQPGILALLRLPEGITENQIDKDEPLLLYPAGIEAMSQRVIESRRQGTTQTSIFAFFDKAELMDAVSTNGSVELQVVGNLKTGQYFSGIDTVLVIGDW